MTPDATQAKHHALKAWQCFTRDRNLPARVPDWRTSLAADGSPRVRAEVVGPGKAHALHLFASQYPLILREPGDQRPTYDYSTPGRTTVVWRSGGVWVELWVTDAVGAVEPVLQPVQGATVKEAPAGRLPFRRFRRSNLGRAS